MNRKLVTGGKQEKLGLFTIDFSYVNIRHRYSCLFAFERANIPLNFNEARFWKKKSPIDIKH